MMFNSKKLAFSLVLGLGILSGSVFAQKDDRKPPKQTPPVVNPQQKPPPSKEEPPRKKPNSEGAVWRSEEGDEG